MQLEQTKLQTSRHDEYSAQDIDRLRDSVKETVAVAMETLERRDAMSTKLKYLNASKDLLQDSGIKSRIVKSYLPIINKHVNEILSKLDLYVEFSLDENFSETILQRGRDDMSYNSLSEGEKRRVDLAILYAFRQLCVMKASGGISLVVLDEMDSGLDFEGRAQFVDLVRDMSPNAWVISHAIRGSGLEPMFDKIVGVHKIGNFTVISED
jgi:DNA repair exonuclease SbcCD ATPase subunit